ncbi:MAG TPA: LacI family DNA-binding transcriptional regulator [Candidatus Dormibacteraeota bacterium]|nr:LacI family DNA-binding transcriptional regulator [Candidatus Dormibacteraeota bacterium]
MSRKRITMQMIADASGYSKYVVSKTLNGRSGVSDAAKQKVLAVSKQLGYFKDNQTNVDKLRINETRQVDGEGFVLLVMPNHRYQNSESKYWGKVFDGIVDALERKNIGVIVLSSQNNLSGHVRTNRLLGVITVGLVSSDMLLELNKHSVPIVMVDHEETMIQADTIFMDNRGGVNALTNYLIGMGHESMLFIGNNLWSPSFYDRWLGFKTALEKNNLYARDRNYLLNIDYNAGDIEEQIQAHIDQLENRGNLPTAFVCANDNIAEHVMAILSKKGYHIPDDCSVTGFDNLETSAQLNPPLTSIHVFKEAIGQRAVNMLFWRLENFEFPSEKVHVYCDMVIRGSVGTSRQAEQPIKN